MDIGVLMCEVEKVREAILNGKVYAGISHLHRLHRTGFPVDYTLVEDILDVPCFVDYLYDETFMGDATNAARCLAAFKDLGLVVDSRKINYIRFKKLSVIGQGLEQYFESARAEFRRLLRTLQSFFTHVGDYRECVLHKSDNRLTFEEEVLVRFPNRHFRDLFLQVAFQRAIEKGLSFNWENHQSLVNQELTGRIRWSLIQQDTRLATDWYRSIKARFDDFIQQLINSLETLNLPRYLPIPRNQSEMMWVVFSKDSTVSSRITTAMRGYNTIQIQDLGLLSRYFAQNHGEIGAFIFHVTLKDFDLLQAIVEFKLQQPTTSAPFVVLAERTFFKIMKDYSMMFPGCEHVAEMNPANVQNLEYVLSRLLQNRRRFIRLALDMDCQAVFKEESEHTRATPVSAGGAFLRTHRAFPVFRTTELNLREESSGFEESMSGRVVYNAPGGVAVEFDNLIPFEKFQQLRAVSLTKHEKIVDTLKRSRV